MLRRTKLPPGFRANEIPIQAKVDDGPRARWAVRSADKEKLALGAVVTLREPTATSTAFQATVVYVADALSEPVYYFSTR